MAREPVRERLQAKEQLGYYCSDETRAIVLFYNSYNARERSGQNKRGS